jgi:hypothetical protein
LCISAQLAAASSGRISRQTRPNPDFLSIYRRSRRSARAGVVLALRVGRETETP